MIKQRPRIVPDNKPNLTIGNVSKQESSPMRKKWAIGRRKILDASIEEERALIRREMGMDEKCEDPDQPASNTSFSEPSGPLSPNDLFDFEEYDKEDNPVADPDGVTYDSSWDKNDFEASMGNSDPEPVPGIIIDEHGNVEIPRETLIHDSYGRFGGDGKELPPRALQRLNSAEKLRAVADALIKKEGQTILRGDSDFSQVKLLPLTQKEVMEPLGMVDKGLRSSIADRYVKTPLWGILPLSVFFQGKEKTNWSNILDYVRKTLKGEDIESPYDNDVLWPLVKQEFSLTLKSNKTLNNKLLEAGIPLKKPRVDIYTLTKEWKMKGNVQEVRSRDIPGIREDLQKKFTGHTSLCRREQYTPFVEERIRAVLNKLKVVIK
jgi:hypothetical protein